jgi:arylformamidase
MRIALVIAVSVAALTTTLALAAPERLSRECRREVVKLCGLKRDNVLGCILSRQSELSQDCRTSLRDRVVGKRQSAVESPVAGIPPRELVYGSDPLQRLDFYAGPKGQSLPPLIVNVHGG